MINGIRIKVCGLTSLVDADAADAVGVDYLGFIFHPPSPRGVTPGQFQAMSERLPPRKRVAVCVEPAPERLAELLRLEVDRVQIHFAATTPLATLASWAEQAGRDRLWLAPKLPPGTDVQPEWLPLADTFLLDTFHPEKFGGTGETGDWPKFARHQLAHGDKTWILSGGLKPENIAAAVAATGANFVDVNSGVEQAPGVKSPARLKAFVTALHHATKQGNPLYHP